MSDAVTVHGGVGGTRALLDDLVLAAVTLRTAASGLSDVTAQLLRAGTGVSAEARWSPATAAAAMAAIQAAAQQVEAVKAWLDDVAVRLAATESCYRGAELSAERLAGLAGNAAGVAGGSSPLVLGLAMTGLGGLLVQAGLAAGVVRQGRIAPVVGGDRLTPGTEALTAVLPAMEPAVAATGSMLRTAGAHPATPPDREAQLAALALTHAIAATQGLAARLEVTGRVVDGQRPAARGAAEVLSRLSDLYPYHGGTPGTVGVERLDHPDGSRTWVVQIPGTQSMELDGQNPLNFGANLQLMAGAAPDSALLVADALAQAGAEPTEPVLLAGHSQGGMIAVRLAGDAAFTSRFTVAAVLTAGSPVGAMPLPGGTQALHLEHRQDAVPLLDGTPNPDLPHRTTVTRDLAADRHQAGGAQAGTLAGGHGIAGYVRT